MFFINLAIMTKLHLDDLWDSKTDYQLLFDYYNFFLGLSKYEKIEVRYFAKKLLRETIRKKKTYREVNNIEDFGRNNNRYLLDSNWEEGERDNNAEKDNDVPKSNKE